ncbi:hypothetical protein I4F81_002348 [Pyropia yezoensis]|uniref:Uncharacterized protein n=1 Tax=Pyropia yezoensis TaxID=2788 RepID=A0ACC3BP75_PYRYE|nr:hypothetical protein I4F81_002348 [Neopyropia yezoensis]
MAGGPADAPPGGALSTDAAAAADLRARLDTAETALAETQQHLTTAQGALADRDAAAAAAALEAAGNPLRHGGAPARAGAGGGAAADRLPAEEAAAANAARRAANLEGVDGDGARRGDEAPPAGPLGPDGAPPGGADYAVYGDEDEGSDGDALGGWAPAGGAGAIGRRGSARRRALDEAGAYDDGFDFAARFSASDYLQSFDIPRSIMRADGLPMPFTPCDPVHASTFTAGSRDEIEALRAQPR